MAEQTKKSVMFIVEETVAGTPEEIVSGSEALSLQDGFSMKPSFNELENAELSPQIGTKPAILGLEQPESEASHYIRHSGVEAVEPKYGVLLKAAIGDKVAAPIEGLTVAASTVSLIKGNAGAGVKYPVGSAILLKDTINGYRIRNVKAVSGDDLTLGFQLPTGLAPAAGVAMGRPIFYKPADELPSLTKYLFRGNGAVTEIMSGARVAEMSIEAVAGELLNGTFSFNGTSYYYDGQIVNATNFSLDFVDGAGVKAVSLPQKFYKDQHEIAETLESLMNAVSLDTITVKYLDSGKYRFTSTGATLSLLFSTGVNTATNMAALLAFTLADYTALLTYTSDLILEYSVPFTPVADADINPLVVKNNEILIGDADDYACAHVQEFTATVSNELADVPDICSESGIAEKIMANREVTSEITATLQRHESDRFKKFRKGEDISFAFNGGVKLGGNWVAGKCVNFYIPQGRISEFELDDADGVITMKMTIKSYVSETFGMVYMSLL